MQIVQRILTKLRGSEDQLASLIGVIDREQNLTDSKLLELFTKYKDISNFELSRNVIYQKAKELKVHGYTI